MQILLIPNLAPLRDNLTGHMARIHSLFMSKISI